MDVTHGLPASSLVDADDALAPAPLSDVLAEVPAFPLQATSCRYAAVNRYEKGASIIKPHLGTRSL